MPFFGRNATAIHTVHFDLFRIKDLFYKNVLYARQFLTCQFIFSSCGGRNFLQFRHETK